MAFQVVMPKLSDAMEQGRIIQWLKKEGDAVQGGDVLASIETDKAEIEMEAFGAGTLRKILAPEGASVPVGNLIAVIAEADEDISGLLAPPAGSAAPAAPAPLKVEALKPAPPPAAPAPSAAPPVEERVVASPIARRLAQEAGIDLALIAGTGPGGRIVERDIEAYLAKVARPAAVPSVGVEAGPEFEDRELSTIRKTIAARLVQSKGPVPFFDLTAEIDMAPAMELRKAINLLDEQAPKVSVTDMIVKGCAIALLRHPWVNAGFLGDKARFHRRAHIGVAVALEEGLVTPVIRDCHRKGLREIAGEGQALIERARGRKLRPEEYTGGTFTVSNLGMYDIEEFAAIIDPPQGAILAVGAVVQKPVVRDGALAAGTRMRVTLSCDHRIIDGATGAKFLQELKRILEQPLSLLA